MTSEWELKGKGKQTPIREFKLINGELIGVFQGSKGNKPDLDILIKYRDNYTKKFARTPKHIHWVIDLLIKKEYKEKLTLEFIDYLLNMYKKIEPFKTKEEQQACKIKFTNSADLKKFEELNKYGQYSVEFIGHIIELFSIEEKTGFDGAFIFEKLLTALKERKDVFYIVSQATYKGRI